LRLKVYHKTIMPECEKYVKQDAHGENILPPTFSL